GSTVTINVVGSRPLALLSHGSIVMTGGTINSSAVGAFPGAGGGSGGGVNSDGGGPGGGGRGHADCSRGGGGRAVGGPGGRRGAAGRGGELFCYVRPPSSLAAC